MRPPQINIITLLAVNFDIDRGYPLCKYCLNRNNSWSLRKRQEFIEQYGIYARY